MSKERVSKNKLKSLYIGQASLTLDQHLGGASICAHYSNYGQDTMDIEEFILLVNNCITIFLTHIEIRERGSDLLSHKTFLHCARLQRSLWTCGGQTVVRLRPRQPCSFSLADVCAQTETQFKMKKKTSQSWDNLSTAYDNKNTRCKTQCHCLIDGSSAMGRVIRHSVF